MSSLLCLLGLLAATSGPTVLEELAIDAEEGATLVRITLKGAPSFTTSEEPGLFVIDFVGLEAAFEDVEEVEAAGLLAVRNEARPEGHRLQLFLEPGAHAEPLMADGALVIRVVAPAETDPVEAMNAAMESLATQVARMGDGVRDLSGAPAKEEAVVVAAIDTPEATPAEGEAVVQAEEPAAADVEPEVEEAVEPEGEPEAVAASEPDVQPAAVVAVEPEAEPAPAVATPEAEPEVATADPEPAVVPAAAETSARPITPPPAPPALVVDAVASSTSELVRLGFRPTPTGAMVLVALEGEIVHRLEEHEDKVILELEGTRIRRANDKRPLDTSFFGTPVRSVRAVEDRARRITRIEIDLFRPAEVSLQQHENEIAIAFGERPAG